MRIGFITCADLSRYFVSKTNPLFTHDDQIACDYLAAKGINVEPVVWGDKVEASRFDLLVVRSPWDYSNSDEKRKQFFDWLRAIDQSQIKVSNPYAMLLWNLDKHYLRELETVGVRIVPSEFIEPEDAPDVLFSIFKKYDQIVVKPCVSAGARDTFRIMNEGELPEFLTIFQRMRGDRSFIAQPFIEEIAKTGEWSLVFLNGLYSHAVLKLPKPGGWLVQDELGGSVQCLEPPKRIVDFAVDAYEKLGKELLYARVDILGDKNLMLGELELVEPELFFLDRRNNAPNMPALEKFHAGIMAAL